MPDGTNSHAGPTMTINGFHMIGLARSFFGDHHMIGLVVVASPLLMCPFDVSAMMDITDVLTNETGAVIAMKIGAVMR